MANRYLSIASIIEKNQVASAVAWVPLFEVEVIDPDTGVLVETLRFAQNTENVTFQGQVYSKARFDFSVTEETGSQPEVKLVGYDYTRAIQRRMQDHGGGIGFKVRLIVVNTGNLSAPPEITELFEVVGASQQDYAVSFTLGAENPLTFRFPRRRQFRDRCQWRYKGAECAYAGPLGTCDFTLNGSNGCVAHGNEERFGGFPGIRRQ